MKPEGMIVNGWYLYTKYNWLFVFEKIVEYSQRTNVHCYEFYVDIIRNKTKISTAKVGIIDVNNLKDVIPVNIEDYNHLFDINSLPNDNLFKKQYIRKQRIKMLLNELHT